MTPWLVQVYYYLSESNTQYTVMHRSWRYHCANKFQYNVVKGWVCSAHRPYHALLQSISGKKLHVSLSVRGAVQNCVGQWDFRNLSVFSEDMTLFVFTSSPLFIVQISKTKTLILKATLGLTWHQFSKTNISKNTYTSPRMETQLVC